MAHKRKKRVPPILTHYVEFNGFGQYKIVFVSDKTELTTDALSKAAFYRTFSCYGLWANCLPKIIHTKATPIATKRERETRKKKYILRRMISKHLGCRFLLQNTHTHTHHSFSVYATVRCRYAFSLHYFLWNVMLEMFSFRHWALRSHKYQRRKLMFQLCAFFLTAQFDLEIVPW